MIELNAPIFFGLAFFRTALPCSPGPLPCEGWDAITYDAVGVNCKKGAGAGYMGKMVCVGLLCMRNLI